MEYGVRNREEAIELAFNFIDAELIRVRNILKSVGLKFKEEYKIDKDKGILKLYLKVF